MAENSTSQDIVIKVRGDNSALAQSLQDAGIKVEKFAGTVKEGGGLGREGMMMISMSAQQAAMSLGLPGPVARKLGGEIDNVVASFGKFATGIGIATVVIATAIAAYNKYADYKKNQREELERSVGAIKGEVMALYDSAGVSDQVRRATYDLTLAKRDLMRVNLAQLIIAENAQLIEQSDNLKSVGSSLDWLKRIAEAARYTFAGMLAPDFGDRLKTLSDEYYAKQKAEVGILDKKKKLHGEIEKIISGAAPSYDKNQYSDIDKLKDEEAYLRAHLEMRRSEKSVSAEWEIQEELAIYDKGTELMLARLDFRKASGEEIENQYETRRMGRRKLEIDLNRKNEVEKWNTARTVTGEMGSLMDRFYEISGQRGKAFFYLSRGLAAASAFCNYMAASAKAAKDAQEDSSKSPYWEYYYKAMAVAVPAAILAESFTGQGGSASAGGGGGGSSSSSSVTEGLPTSTERNQELHIYINGNEMDVPATTEKVVREIWRNNGNVGGLQVGVSGNA